MTDTDARAISDKTVLPKNRGLVNMGNTCYANTTWQCLMHCLPLTLFFLRRTFEMHLGQTVKHEDATSNKVGDSGKRAQATSGTPSLLCMKMYNLFLQEMCTKNVDDAYAPKDLFLTFGKASWCRSQIGETTTSFSLGQQHDMAEYLQFILDMIHDTIYCSVRVEITGKVEGRMDQMLVASYKQFAMHHEKQYSFVSDMMTGQYFIQNQTCDNLMPSEHSDTYDPFTMLTLSIPVGTKKCTMYDCLDVMIQPEIIEGWRGELTDSCRMIERKTFLWRLPQILIIHIKRFVNRHVKNECGVSIEMELNVSNYCLSTDNEHATYRLFAIGNHEGNLHFGHYYADCKNSEGKWHRFNDNQVTEINTNQFNPQSAYILFYYRNMPSST